MQALTAAISDFALTACKIVQKVNLFRNRVNVLRNRDNLFSTTSQIFPQAGEQLTPRSYTVTQLHSVIRFFDVWGWVKGLYL